MKERRYLLKTGVSVMNLDDLKCINEKSIRSAGPRYTPGQDADAPNLEIESLNLALEGLICSPAFRARIHGLANGVEEAFAKVGKNLHDRFPRQFRKPKGLLGVCAVGRLAPRKTGDVLPKVQPGIPDGISGNGRFQIPASARFSIVRVRVLSRFPGINPPVAFASA